MAGDGFPDRHLIQIAGVRDRREADMIVRCGADLLGFPLRLAGGGEDLVESDAGEIIRGLRPPARGVVITYLADARSILELCRTAGSRIVQLHGAVPVTALAALRELSPDLWIIKSLVVRGDNVTALETLVDRTGPFVDAYITDTFDPATGACGATGCTHDWAISRRLVEHSPKPVILAGGLNPGNVREAVVTVRPAGVDTHTGVEGRDGGKDRALVERFVLEARDGFAAL